MNGHGLKQYSFHGHEDGTTTRFSQRGVKIKKEKKSHHAWKVCVHRGKDLVHRAYRRKNRFRTSSHLS